METLRSLTLRGAQLKVITARSGVNGLVGLDTQIRGKYENATPPQQQLGEFFGFMEGMSMRTDPLDLGLNPKSTWTTSPDTDKIETRKFTNGDPGYIYGNVLSAGYNKGEGRKYWMEKTPKAKRDVFVDDNVLNAYVVGFDSTLHNYIQTERSDCSLSVIWWDWIDSNGEEQNGDKIQADVSSSDFSYQQIYVNLLLAFWASDTTDQERENAED